MLSKEYSFSQFNAATSRPLQIRNEYWRLKREGRAPDDNQWEHKLRDAISTSLDHSVRAASRYQGRNTDLGFNEIVSDHSENPLNACHFSELRYRDFIVTPERAAALINSALPFICQFKVGNNQGSHVVLFAGYRYSPGTELNIGFMVRDSRLSQQLDTGWLPYCERASVVYNPDERDSVERLINL